MRASELAYKAAQEMASRGHCKHVQEDAEGRVCFYGALNRAQGLQNMIQEVTAAPLPEGMKFTFPIGAEVMLPPGWAADFAVVSSLGFASSSGHYRVVSVVKDILRERGVLAWEVPHVWNDQADITGEDVILLLKEAGHRLEEEED